MSDFFRKHSMITGTLLLTAAGFAVRILGFFYRIFLSRTIGAEGLGLYNLVHPLYGICFALCAGSIQTAISRCIAANLSRRKLFLRTGLMISLSIAALLAMILYAGSQFLANQILLESRCGEFLRLMALSIPFQPSTPASRLLLWYAADQGSGRVPDHRTADPYGRCLSPGPVFPGRANPHYHGTGCSGTPGPEKPVPAFTQRSPF